MPSSSGKNKNRAMLQAAKALAAAAASLASAAEALTLLCEEDDEDNPAAESGGSVPKDGHKSVVTTLNKPPITGYDSGESDDDDYMALAREEVRAAVGTVPAAVDHTSLESTTGSQSPGAPNKPDLAIPLANIQAPTTNRREPSEFSGFALTGPRFGTTDQSEEWGLVSEAVTWSPRSRPNNGYGTAGSISSHFDIPTSLNDETERNSENNGNRTETPDRAPLMHLKTNWLRPTTLQKEILDSLRTERDMVIYHGYLKSQTHAILVRCMEVFNEQPPRDDPTGIISALIIVPQQTTGRLYFNFANELAKDFGLPHKSLLLPGGGSDVATEAARMACERIDILISTPRVFINHVNSNPSLWIHLSKLRFVVLAGAHELTKTDAFLSFQLNSIRKRMPTRAKSPRQTIITASRMTDEIQMLATRTLTANSDIITSTGSGDELQDDSWEEILQNGLQYT